MKTLIITLLLSSISFSTFAKYSIIVQHYQDEYESLFNQTRDVILALSSPNVEKKGMKLAEMTNKDIKSLKQDFISSKLSKAQEILNKYEETIDQLKHDVKELSAYEKVSTFGHLHTRINQLILDLTLSSEFSMRENGAQYKLKVKVINKMRLVLEKISALQNDTLSKATDSEINVNEQDI